MYVDHQLTIQQPLVKARTERDTVTDLRCSCGRLLAKKRFGAIEVKCPRCKKVCSLNSMRSSGGEIRCECRRLLARSVPDGFEFKCGRCKKVSTRV